MATEYHEVTGDDRAVGAFIAAHPYDVNLLHLPRKCWVARTGPEAKDIVALLMLNTHPYLALDLIVAQPETRPFRRIFKLWKLAEAWLVAHDVPVICATIPNHLIHYQSLVRRAGFVIAGEEMNLHGEPAETIFIKALTPASQDMIAEPGRVDA